MQNQHRDTRAAMRAYIKLFAYLQSHELIEDSILGVLLDIWGMLVAQYTEESAEETPGSI